MIKAIVCDFFQVILLPKNEVSSTLQDTQSVFGNYIFNHQLTDFLQLQNVKKVIFSNSGSLLEMPLIKPKLSANFNYIYSAKNLQTSKSLPAGYMLLAKKLKLKPEQIVFIDDRYENVQAARQTEMHTIQFFNNAETISQLKHLLKSSL